MVRAGPALAAFFLGAAADLAVAPGSCGTSFTALVLLGSLPFFSAGGGSTSAAEGRRGWGRGR